MEQVLKTVQLLVLQRRKQAQRNGMALSWSQTDVFVIKHGFHPMGSQLYSVHSGRTHFLILHLFWTDCSQLRAKATLKHQFRWYCNLLESLENFGVKHIFLLRTSSEINNYFISYSDDCILFDLFFSKLFNSLRPKSLHSDLNKEIGAAGFETVKCRAWIGAASRGLGRSVDSKWGSTGKEDCGCIFLTRGPCWHLGWTSSPLSGLPMNCRVLSILASPQKHHGTLFHQEHWACR